MDRQIQQYKSETILMDIIGIEYAWPNIKINGKIFSDLLDIESDITIISKYLWPKSWPIQKISCQVAGISQTEVQEISQNVQIYPHEGPKGEPATFKTVCDRCTP